jgi:two-component system, NarL family, sensor histidine kinase UhpB
MKTPPPGLVPRYSFWRDIAIAAAAGVLVAVIAAVADFSEKLFVWTRTFESLQIDEWPIALLAFAVSMVVLYARRLWQLRGALRENRRLVERLLAVQEQERRSIARELHDELGQTLNAIRLDALALQSTDLVIGSEDDVAGRIAGNAERVYRAAGDLMRQLRPPALDELGLVDALEACVERWRGSYPSLSVQLSTGGRLDDLGESLNLALYRIVQEGLTNCVRHAGARHFFVDLTRGPGSHGRILLEMRDDGVGFDPEAPTGGGLMGMRERIQLLRGQFEVLSHPGAGATIRIELPTLEMKE